MREGEANQRVLYAPEKQLVCAVQGLPEQKAQTGPGWRTQEKTLLPDMRRTSEQPKEQSDLLQTVRKKTCKRIMDRTQEAQKDGKQTGVMQKLPASGTVQG